MLSRIFFEEVEEEEGSQGIWLWSALEEEGEAKEAFICETETKVSKT